MPKLDRFVLRLPQHTKTHRRTNTFARRPCKDAAGHTDAQTWCTALLGAKILAQPQHDHKHERLWNHPPNRSRHAMRFGPGRATFEVHIVSFLLVQCVAAVHGSLSPLMTLKEFSCWNDLPPCASKTASEGNGQRWTALDARNFMTCRLEGQKH